MRFTPEFVEGIRVLLVTGPQRSGTRFASQAFAADLGWQHVDEREFDIQATGLWWSLVDTGERLVVQCPAMMRFVHEGVPDDVLVAVMRRPVEDIVASQYRIDWHYDRTELARYGLNDGVISQVKYDHWDANKHSGQPARWLEVDYDEMADHPMWVDPEHRNHFAFDQTTVQA